MKNIILIIFTIVLVIIISCIIHIPSPADQNIKDYYYKVCNAPYKRTYGPYPDTLFTTGGDCDDRARNFKEYLESQGATNVKVVWVCHEDNGQINWTYGAHEFLLWNGKAYNPTILPELRAYNMPLTDYLQSTKRDYGFNTYHDGAFENQTQKYYF